MFRRKVTAASKKHCAKPGHCHREWTVRFKKRLAVAVSSISRNHRDDHDSDAEGSKAEGDAEASLTVCKSRLRETQRALKRMEKLQEILNIKYTQIRNEGDRLESKRRRLIDVEELHAVNLSPVDAVMPPWHGLLASPVRSHKDKSSWKQDSSYTFIRMLIFVLETSGVSPALEALNNYTRDRLGFPTTITMLRDSDPDSCLKFIPKLGFINDLETEPLYVLYFGQVPSLLAAQCVQTLLDEFEIAYSGRTWSLLLIFDSTDPILMREVPINFGTFQKYEIISWETKFKKNAKIKDTRPFAVRVLVYLKAFRRSRHSVSSARISGLITQLRKDSENKHGSLTHVVGKDLNRLGPIGPLFSMEHVKRKENFYPLPINKSLIDPHAYSDVCVLMLSWNEGDLHTSMANLTDEELRRYLGIDPDSEEAALPRSYMEHIIAPKMEYFNSAVTTDLFKLREVFEVDYHYQVDTFEIPMDWDEDCLYTYLEKYRRNHNLKKDSLWIIYYGGHGSNIGGALFWCPDRRKSHKIRWTDLQADLQKEVDADLLFIYDCCDAGASESILQKAVETTDYRLKKARQPKQEILAGAAKNQTASGIKGDNFTTALAQLLRRRAYEEGQTTVDAINSTLYWSLFQDPFRADISGRKALESSIHLQPCYPRLQRFVKDWYGDLCLEPDQVLVVVVKHERHCNPANQLQDDLFTLICSGDKDVEHIMHQYWLATNLKASDLANDRSFRLKYRSIYFDSLPFIRRWYTNRDGDNGLHPKHTGVGYQLIDLPDYRTGSGWPIIFEAVLGEPAKSSAWDRRYIARQTLPEVELAMPEPYDEFGNVTMALVPASRPDPDEGRMEVFEDAVEHLPEVREPDPETANATGGWDTITATNVPGESSEHTGEPSTDTKDIDPVSISSPLSPTEIPLPLSPAPCYPEMPTASSRRLREMLVLMEPRLEVPYYEGNLYFPYEEVWVEVAEL